MYSVDRGGRSRTPTYTRHRRRRHPAVLRRHAAQALVACASVTLGAVATALDISIDDGKVYAEGRLDFEGTLGVDKERRWASRASG